jgi:hypothetical protein
MQPYPPLQTLVAAACLRSQGYTVALLDTTINAPEPAFERALEQLRPRLVAVCEDNFNFLTKMCLLRNRELAGWMAASARRAGVPAITNGADAGDHAAEYLHAGFACVMKGEVEEAIVEVARCLLAGNAPGEQIRGIAFEDPVTGHVRHTAPRAPIENLDALPMPAWDLVDAEPYRRAWTAAHGYFSLNMVSSRGCPYRCNWCAKPIWSDNYRCRAARLVAEEMLEVKRRFRPGHLWFSDDIFALSGHWTSEFTAAVEELGAQIPFKMQSRCDLMTRQTVADLHRAGCVEVWMGVESGAQQVLDAMDKTLIPSAKDSDDLDMMFQGAFTTEFYRALADALHAEVREGRTAAGGAWANVLALKETCARKAPIWISC